MGSIRNSEVKGGVALACEGGDYRLKLIAPMAIGLLLTLCVMHRLLLQSGSTLIDYRSHDTDADTADYGLLADEMDKGRF